MGNSSIPFNLSSRHTKISTTFFLTDPALHRLGNYASKDLSTLILNSFAVIDIEGSSGTAGWGTGWGLTWDVVSGWGGMLPGCSGILFSGRGMASGGEVCVLGWWGGEGEVWKAGAEGFRFFGTVRMGEWVDEREGVLDWGEGDLIGQECLLKIEHIRTLSAGYVKPPPYDPLPAESFPADSFSTDSPSASSLSSPKSSSEVSSLRWVYFSCSEGPFLNLNVNLGLLGAGASGAGCSSACVVFLASSFRFNVLKSSKLSFRLPKRSSLRLLCVGSGRSASHVVISWRRKGFIF